jgi:hypothetical protein
MQRTTVVAEIFGYLVCLFTVVVFFVSVAGIVNGVFRTVNPMAQPRIVMRHMGWMHAGGGPQTSGMMMHGGFNPAKMHAQFGEAARYAAVQRLVLSIVMLILAIVVFRRAFDWLNPRQPTAS